MSKELRLNCNRCGSFRDYDRKSGDPKSVVRCDGCGKRHSTDSIHFVDPTDTFERDEEGALVEKPV